MPTINAYLSRHSRLRGADLHKESPEQLIDGLMFIPGDWPKKDPDCLLVGTAEITVTLADRADVVRNQIAVLRKQQQTVRAMAEKESTRIKQQINSLLAIEGAATEWHERQRQRRAGVSVRVQVRRRNSRAGEGHVAQGLLRGEGNAGRGDQPDRRRWIQFDQRADWAYMQADAMLKARAA